MLIAAAYASQRQGWRTPSSVFVLAPDCSKFEPHHTLATVGAHDVETISVGNNHFAFFSSDREGDNTHIHSELFQWRETPAGKQNGKLVSVQKLLTNGAHAAEFFKVAANGKSGCSLAGGGVGVGGGGGGGGAGEGEGEDRYCYFLAVANLGSRQLNKYRTQSYVYRFHPLQQPAEDGASSTQSSYLKKVQEIDTVGATDFEAFEGNDGTTYVIAANEQDDKLGGDVDSTLWRLAPGSAGGAGGADAKQKDEL